MHQSSAVLNVKFTLRGTRAVHRWCARTANTPSAGTAWNLWTMTFSWSTMTKGRVETNWGTPGRLLSGTEHRLWESLLDLACSCWLPPPSFFWPLRLSSAASASAAKAMTTHYRPKTHHQSWSGEPLRGWAIFFSFSPLYILFLPPALSASFFGSSLHRPPAALGSIALHERGMVEKRPDNLAQWEMQGQRSEEVRLV